VGSTHDPKYRSPIAWMTQPGICYTLQKASSPEDPKKTKHTQIRLHTPGTFCYVYSQQECKGEIRHEARNYANGWENSLKVRPEIEVTSLKCF
jgi:hypothetical protein